MTNVPSAVTVATIEKLRQLASEIECGERRVCSAIIEEASERPVQTHTFVTERLEHGFPDRCECVPGEYDCGCSTEDGLAHAARAEPPCGRELDGGHGRCVLYYPHEGWCTPTMLDAAGDWTDEDRDNGCRPARQGTFEESDTQNEEIASGASGIASSEEVLVDSETCVHGVKTPLGLELLGALGFMCGQCIKDMQAELRDLRVAERSEYQQRIYWRRRAEELSAEVKRMTPVLEAALAWDDAFSLPDLTYQAAVDAATLVLRNAITNGDYR